MSDDEDARRALGEALQRDAAAVGDLVVARAGRLLSRYDEAAGRAIADSTRATCTYGTRTVGVVLATGSPPTREDWSRISHPGRAPLLAELSLADMTKLYLYWRDVAAEHAGRLAEELGVGAATLDHARWLIAAGCDASLVRTAKAFDETRRELESALETERAQLAHLARHDALTGLPNRAALLDRLAQVTGDLAAPRGAAVLFLDLDGFKAVNDGAGHRAGDELLGVIARRLLGVIRPGDLLARLGGDEFVVLCEGLVDPARDADGVRQRLRAALSEPVCVGGVEYRVGASVGVALVGPNEEPGVVLDRADAAMYAEKTHRSSAPQV